ncbi:MAG: hypothetical protein L0H10_01970 [Comamonas sp.]|uniref:hypothetical protein n=1 Tax=Comamonas sp. TaxID=34028 RepID=UPI002647D347|nr:hypothetical protein [Comamonas sp.]MDN5502576.1 hypothetical protein [Comamonas sp.]MDN5536474.1 hypothetical protein [Comamonas sp.]
MNKKIFLDFDFSAILQKWHGFQVLWVRLFMAFFALASGEKANLSTSLMKASWGQLQAQDYPPAVLVSLLCMQERLFLLKSGGKGGRGRNLSTAWITSKLTF